MDIVGDPPELAGLRCEAFICEGYLYKGESVATANVAHLCFSGVWHRLTIDGGVIFWRRSAETPSPWTVESEGWEYPHVDVGAAAGIVACRLDHYRMETTATGARVSFAFQNGRAITINNEGDRTTYRVS